MLVLHTSMKTIAYMRVSTSAQLEKSGIPQQSKAISAYAAALGKVVDEWVTDGATGMTDDRPGIQSILARDDIDMVIFDRMDRLGRTADVCLSLKRKIMAKGIELRCVQHEIDGPSGKLIATIMS